MEMAEGGRKMGSRIPNWHTDELFGKVVRQEEWTWQNEFKVNFDIIILSIIIIIAI